MKKIIPIILLILLLLSACGFETKVDPTPTPIATLEPTPTPTPEPTPTPDLNTYDDLIASVYSHVEGSDDDRMNNIKLAIEKINGIKIQSGEVFSFNDAVGLTTEENGFKYAPIYNDRGRYPDDEVFEYGGGVNQVASTLYCASLYGCMNPVERYPHHFAYSGDGYLRRGRDAYVSNNGIDEIKDLKFENSLEYPVLIKVFLDEDPDSDKLYVEIYGYNPDGLRGEPWTDTNSLYLAGFDYVCDRYQSINFRTVTDSNGNQRVDDINFDYDGDGKLDYDIYYWHERDYVW